jgi:hypothetical protein
MNNSPKFSMQVFINGADCSIFPGVSKKKTSLKVKPVPAVGL